MKYTVLILTFFFLVGSTRGQDDSLSSKALAASVMLDSVVISATRSGFDVEDFINLVRSDTSLYTAFSNLRRVSCEFHTEMQFEDRKEQLKAGLSGDYRQVFEDSCRELKLKEEQTFGNYYKGKKNKRRYYTSSLYESVFITKGRVCYDSNSSTGASGSSPMDKHIGELKKLIFSPGSHADVPLIGNKTEVFSSKMVDYYDFLISADTLDDVPVYIFEARVKDEFVSREAKTVIKSLKTWFERKNFQVISRNYTLAHNTALYMFDVTMHIDLVRIDEQYYPLIVKYDGTWNIPTRKRETGTFEITFRNYEH